MPSDNPQTTPRIFNKRYENPDGAVYIRRPGKWGNPFEIGKHGTREQVIERYRAWICDQPASFIAEIRNELRGRDLLCWCSPRPCHGHILMEIANA